ncbi:hypothetical protein ACHAQF_005033 [Verticillium nonalfalfae]
MSRFITKLKPKPGTAKQDTTLVPLSDVPDGEPKVRNRFTWGNYVAMSYSWGKKEDWEFTEKEREEAARKEEEENEKKRLDPTYKPAVTDEDDDAGTYTDGDVHEVILDGKRVRVRYNLWAALLAFREMAPFKEGIWLWNDALCINQQYETEAGLKDQARQLPLMSVIYRQAGNIIIHAGGGYHHDEDTPWVLEYLQEIGVNYRTEYYEALDHAEPTIAHSHRFQAELELKKAARAWVEGAQEDMRKAARQGDTDYAMVSLYDFFDRPYWRRLWIIQELAMAHSSAPILCGDIVTQWRYVRDGALLLSMMADAVRDSMQRALAASGRSTKREPSFEHVAAIAELAMFGNQTLHRDDSFLYKRNWDFIQANRELPIAGKPLSSYFTFQPIQQSHLNRLNGSDEHSYHKIAEAHRAMEARTRLRRLMTTSNRALMGLVPASTQQGDVVIILYYHSRPLIATVVIPDGAPEDTDDIVFKLKGEAFIPGVMNGELADSGELDTLPLNNLTFN